MCMCVCVRLHVRILTPNHTFFCLLAHKLNLRCLRLCVCMCGSWIHLELSFHSAAFHAPSSEKNDKRGACDTLSQRTAEAAAHGNMLP